MRNNYTKVDKTIFSASKMTEQGNADFAYWFNKPLYEKLSAAAIMISVAFRLPDFLDVKVDRTIYSSRKHL